MTKRTPPYSPEVRERAVRMVLDHQGERARPHFGCDLDQAACTIEVRPDCFIVDGTDIFWRDYMELGPPILESGPDEGLFRFVGTYGTRRMEYCRLHAFDENEGHRLARRHQVALRGVERQREQDQALQEGAGALVPVPRAAVAVVHDESLRHRRDIVDDEIEIWIELGQQVEVSARQIDGYTPVGAVDPLDPEAFRVLTLMLAEEW